MQPFTTLTGRLALLPWTDVNTDIIIPARYLKRVERVGFGPLAFADRRYAPGSAPSIDNPDEHGPLNAEFPLNTPEAQAATILVVGKNFGCGSSREHAVWAIAQAGYKVLIAPGIGEGFADIFEQNAFNNGLLAIELPESDWSQLAELAGANPKAEATVNLVESKISAQPPNGSAITIDFAIPADTRNRLLKGLDAVAETLAHEPAIAAYEASAPAWLTPPRS
jgi:3-isopropylmalate/(R)-2-methylmalate dehydratase small subunit